MMDFLTTDPWYYQTDSDWRFTTPDKFQHYWGSFALAWAIDPKTAFLCGVVKEIYDNKYSGGFSYRDLVADAAGVLAAKWRKSKMQIWLDYNRTDKYMTLNLGIVF